MKVKIIVDSCCDLAEKMKTDMNIEVAPLVLNLEDKSYIDDETLDIKQYIEDMARCSTAPKTACPSPEAYARSYKGPESTFVVTISSALSGSYNSAVLAKNIFLEEMGEKFIHVFDSLSASAGETIITMKIHELSKLNFTELEIVERVLKYIHEMKTFFILESLNHLVKAGRMNPIIAKIASVLSIKPIMGGDENGMIKLVEKTRGYKNALKRLLEIIGEEGKDLEQKVLGIAHCNCLEKALELKKEVMKIYNFKDIVIVEMRGVSTTYADNGGIVIAF
jgi:DegV family protein with EDD domain